MHDKYVWFKDSGLIFKFCKLKEVNKEKSGNFIVGK